MRIIAILLIAICTTVSLFAGKISVEEAQKVASQFMSKNVAARSAGAEWKLAWMGESHAASRSTTEAPFYLFTSLGNGFVVVAGDDLVTPVLGYSDTKEFKLEGMPQHIRSWFSEYTRQIEWARNQDNYYDAKAAAEWKSLRNGTYRPIATRTEGSKLIQTAEWDQLSPYNELCPILEGKRCLVGCVATAMAIHMKAVGYPTKINPVLVEYVTLTHDIEVSRTLSSSYSWSDEALPMVFDDKSTPAQNAAIANLMADCGAISSMDYNISEYGGSGTSQRGAARAMIDYFDYDQAAEDHMMDSCSIDQWDYLLKNEINAGRPILYYGAEKGEGAHEFILDGYMPDYMYHFNWGWGGSFNGYFALSALNPGTSEFPYAQSAITNLKPNAGGVLVPYLVDGNREGIEASVEEFAIGEEFVVNVGKVKNYSLNQIEGKFCLLHIDKTGKFIEEISTAKPINNFGEGSWYSSLKFKAIINEEIAEGDAIVLSLLSSYDNEYHHITAKWGDVVDKILLTNSSGIEQPQTTTIKVYSADGGIRVEGEMVIGKTITVFGLDGVEYNRTNATSDTTFISLPAGIYVVKTGNDRSKVIVK